MSDVTICEVFRSPKREGMYIYVDKAEGLERVPETLMQAFGTPESALIFKLSAGRKLANADAGTVLAAIEDAGYYLQMPPASNDETEKDSDAH